MSTLSASRLRIPPKTFDDVVYNGESVKVTHLGGKELYLISREDMELLQNANADLQRELNEARDVVKEMFVCLRKFNYFRWARRFRRLATEKGE